MKSKIGDWFEYDWPIEGKTARFAVDLAHKYAGKTDEYPYLFFVNCASKKKVGLSERFKIRLFANHLKLMIEPMYVGSIKTKKQVQYYFYAKSNAMLDEAKALAKKQRSLRCRVDCIHEPMWDTYFNVLCPDDAKKQTEKNRETLELMEKHGYSLSSTRRISLHMYFPSEPKLLEFAEAARLGGFAIGDTEFMPEQTLPHGIIIIHLSSLRKKEIDDITTRAIVLAKQYGGTLNYWDCPK